jgi:Group 4 capsule polysaccharide lipoprotein gfcB, YjbF
MRKFLSLPLVFLLTACADSDVLQVGDFVLSSFDKTQQKVPRERAAGIPYATMGMELGSSAQALLILGTIAQNELDWFAGQDVFVRTRNGRVIRTAGLPYDLGGLRDLSEDLARRGAASGSAPWQFSLDFPDLGIFGATAQCSSRDRGDDSVEIFGSRISTRHIVEHCTVQTMRWNFDNEFWMDKTTGYVWRSSQHIHPQSPPLILEVLRPEQNNPG